MTAFIDWPVSEGHCSVFRYTEENARASGRGNSLEIVPQYIGSPCFQRLLELLLYSDSQIYEGQSYKMKYWG